MFRFLFINFLGLVYAFSVPRTIKQIATVGPACNNYGTLKEMHNCGVNTFRINMGHCKEHNDFMHTYQNLDNLRKNHKNVEILVDLQGPKFRIGSFKKKFTVLKEGDTFIFDKNNRESENYRVFLGHDEIYRSVNVNDTILLDDGMLEVKVTKILNDERIVTKVIRGGILRENKGINLPYVNVQGYTITPKDAIDIAVINNLKIDWIALSFVQGMGDIKLLRSLLSDSKPKPKIMAKIERPTAVHNYESIIEESDGIMIARGDLGIELGLEHVPFIQKLVIKRCNEVKKEVVVATQMLESMIINKIPTRAEVSDITNAVMDGATGVMLSAETAAGKYPLECVKMQRRCIDTTIEYLKEIDDCP